MLHSISHRNEGYRPFPEEDRMDQEAGNRGEQADTFGSDDFDLRAAAKGCLTPCSSPSNLTRSICGLLPILDWLPQYRWKKNLAADVVAGLTTGVMHVPQGIAYAILSGVDPVNGLYASLLAPLIYFLFGTSRHTSLGSFAVVALMTGVTNEKIFNKYYPNSTESATQISPTELMSPDDVSPSVIAATLTFAVGLVQLATAVFKLDFIATYFSDPLVAGFSTGAAVHVLFSQLDKIMGLKLSRMSGAGYLFKVAYRLISSVPLTNLAALTASLISGAFLVAGKDYISPLINKYSPYHVVVPYDLLVLIVSTALSYVYNWSSSYNIPIVGEIPTGLPLPKPPNISILPDCVGGAIAIAVVSIAVHLSMAKILAKRYKYKIDPAQELYALGLSSTLSGFFPVYPTSTALGRTMVNVESGARTQLSILFGSIFLLAVIFLVGPLFRTLPLCMLSVVILVSLRPMFRKFNELPQLYRVSKYDFLIWVVSFVATVVIDVIGGLVVSIALALLTVVLRTQRAKWNATIHKSTIGGICICVYHFDSSLLFTNSQVFTDSVRKTTDKWGLSCEDWQGLKKLLVLDFSAVADIDSAGIGALKEVLRDLRESEIQFALSSVRGNIKNLILSDKGIGAEETIFFATADEAMNSAKMLSVANGISVTVSTI